MRFKPKLMFLNQDEICERLNMLANLLFQSPFRYFFYASLFFQSNVRKEVRKQPDPPCVVCKGSGRADCHHCRGRGISPSLSSPLLGAHTNLHISSIVWLFFFMSNIYPSFFLPTMIIFFFSTLIIAFSDFSLTSEVLLWLIQCCQGAS